MVTKSEVAMYGTLSQLFHSLRFNGKTPIISPGLTKNCLFFGCPMKETTLLLLSTENLLLVVHTRNLTVIYFTINVCDTLRDLVPFVQFKKR